MSYGEQYVVKNHDENLRLTGSQINLTSRSDQTALETSKRYRPCSAAHSCRGWLEDNANYERPKSAECTNLNLAKFDSFKWPSFSNNIKLSENSFAKVSHFTNSSSQLLQNLLDTHMNKVLDSDRPSNGKSSEEFKKCDSQVAITVNNTKANSNLQLFKRHCESYNSESGSIILNDNPLKEKENFPEVSDEKTVRFCEGVQIEGKKSEEKCGCYKDNENFYSCLKNKFKFCQTYGSENLLNEVKLSEEQGLCNTSDNSVMKVYKTNMETKNLELEEKKKSEIFELPNKTKKVLVLPVHETNSEVESELGMNSDEKKENMIQTSDEDTQDEPRDTDLFVKETQNDCTHQKIHTPESTYDEIFQLLQTLDEEDSESLNIESKQHSPSELAETDGDCPKEKLNYFSAVSSYLEEMEQNDSISKENYASTEKWSFKHFTSPRLEELLNKNTVELAHEVFSLKIQIEDQKKGIKLLKDTLAEMKEAKKVAELEHQEALQKVSSEAENLVQRHQKFIKQLLNEKKNLNGTVSKLVEDIKAGEERYKRNIKAMEEKHLIEIKRAKEAQAVADKIRREKWMENKTQKIKEMTVKGLEPELSRMAARQQEEMTELRNLHKAELEAVELRAARRTSELMDELRAELTKEKERAIAKETNNLRTSMEKEFEDERNKFQQHYQNLKERIRKLEEKLSNQEFEFQQRLLEYKQEEDKKKQKIIREHEENLEEVRRQHLVEIRNLKESAEAEKEVAVNNYKKLQAVKFNEREAELHQQYKRERDREIEMIIETLEKESSQAQLELTRANEGKLKRLKDKMEAEIKEMEVSEAALKEKLTEAKSKISEKEDVITEIQTQMRQLQTELSFFKKSCDEMSLERAKIKEIIRAEFESSISGHVKEKENLEKDIAVLKELHVKELAKKDEQNVQVKYEMQKELTRVYSRIKAAVNKKEKIIESLREENEAINQKCRQLEFMLDQQRRNLLLQFDN